MSKITISTGHPDAGRVYAEAYEESLAREAALTDHLDAALRQVKANWDYAQDKQQRLTATEQRAGELKKLLCDVINEAPSGFAALKVDLANRVNDALKPAAEG